MKVEKVRNRLFFSYQLFFFANYSIRIPFKKYCDTAAAHQNLFMT